MFIRVTSAALLTLAFSGCAVRSHVAPGALNNVDHESAMLLLGISPSYTFDLIRGPVENNVWERPDPFLDPDVKISPKNGYIFVKVKPTTANERFGISTIYTSFGVFGPCQDSTTLVFTLEPGTITYVGELTYSTTGGRLQYTYGLDEEKAKTFLREQYPGAATALTAVPMVPMKVKSTFCNARNITIPIYVPSGR